MTSPRWQMAVLLLTTMPIAIGVLVKPTDPAVRVALVALSFLGLGLYVGSGLRRGVGSFARWRARARVPEPPPAGSHDPADLGDASNWEGGFYELTLELRPADDERLDAALKAVWHHAGVEGCFDKIHGEPASVVPVPIGLASLGDGHLYGVVRLPTGARVVCGVLAIRWDADSDWLTFYVPYGALSASDPAVSEFYSGDGPASLVWRLPIDDWLADVATRVHAEIAIAQGLVGLEDASDFDDFAGGIPDDHMGGYLVPAEGGLAYHRATR